MNARRRYYIVVSRRSGTISWVVLALSALVSATVWGQQPKKRGEPLPLPLLPAKPGWQLLLTSPPSAGGVMDEDRVYIPLESQQVIALERSTGKTLWLVDVESAWPPVAAAGVVFIAASDEIHALDAASGARRWRVPIASPLVAPMAFSAGYLLVPMAPDQVTALRTADGAVAWTRALGGPGGTMWITADNAGIYITVVPGRVVALSPADGRIKWDRAVAGVMTTPAIARERIIVGDVDNDRFYALDAGNGKERWPWDAGGDPVGAAAEKDLVFLVALDNTVKAVKRGNGHQQWRKTLTTRPMSAPYAVGGTVLVVGERPALAAFAAKTGAAMGSYEAPTRLRGAPLVDPAPKPFTVTMVVIMRDGNVVALAPDGLAFREEPAVPLIALPGRVLTREPAPVAQPLR